MDTQQGTVLPTVFVMIPGGWSLPSLFDRLADLITKAGHIAVPLQLPSVGRQFKQDTGRAAIMYDDAKYVNEVAMSYCNNGHKVHLTGNSYGGFVVTEAVKGLPLAKKSTSDGGLIGLVYLASVLPQVGQSIMDVFPADGPFPKPCPDDSDFLMFFEPENAGEYFCSELSPDDRKHYGSMIDVHSLAAFTNPITSAGYEVVPTTYVVAAKDKLVNPDYQHKTVEDANARGIQPVRKAVLEGDHFLMISCAEGVAKILLDMSKDFS